MNNKLVILILVVGFIALFLFGNTNKNADKGNSQEGENGGGQDVPHILGASQFQKEVLKYKGAVLVDFGAGWCPPCKMLSPHLTKLASEMKGKLKVVKVYADEKGNPNDDILNTYKIQGYPTLVLFKSGELVRSRMGYMDYDQLKEWAEDGLKS